MIINARANMYLGAPMTLTWRSAGNPHHELFLGSLEGACTRAAESGCFGRSNPT